jgi:hypothetical protein
MRDNVPIKFLALQNAQFGGDRLRSGSRSRLENGKRVFGHSIAALLKRMIDLVMAANLSRFTHQNRSSRVSQSSGHAPTENTVTTIMPSREQPGLPRLGLADRNLVIDVQIGSTVCLR